MTHEIKAYLQSKENAWAPSTMKSESSRLAAVANFIDGNAATLWRALSAHAPYTRKTTWIRVAEFWDWLNPGQPNPYRQWMKDNARQFKHAYQRRKVDVTFEEAQSLIGRVENVAFRKQALKLLTSGQRFTESFSGRDGRITGKGGKVRVDCSNPDLESAVRPSQYINFWRALRKVGLRPHDLRKLAATRLRERGLSDTDVMEIMGWSDIRTAQVYYQSSKEKELKRKVQEILQGATDGEEQVPIEISEAGE